MSAYMEIRGTLCELSSPPEKCMETLCANEPFVYCPGTDAETAADLFTISRPVAGFGLCLPHARARGWPNFPVETVTRRKESRNV